MSATSRPSKPAQELIEWARHEMIIDHAGELVYKGDEVCSFQLTVVEDGKAFRARFRDGTKVITKVTGDSRICFPFPSVQGTVILCDMENGERHFYDPRTGSQLTQKELVKRNPAFYQ